MDAAISEQLHHRRPCLNISDHKFACVLSLFETSTLRLYVRHVGTFWAANEHVIDIDARLRRNDHVVRVICL